MSEKVVMKCTICGQIVGIRKANSYGCFPVQHNKYYGPDMCHGFYVEGFKVKDNGK